ncbi:MAG: hypothetical protein JST42_11165 [Bacteroidetes bacterium]|nr:hypothetical protein [Bacteroidota bacterium]
MRYIIPLVFLVAGLSSCSRYQYMTLNSPQLSKNDEHQFVFENDTIRLTYDFNGSDGPISVNVYNKTNQPLYVNWKKSALIRNEHALSYYDKNAYFQGSSDGYAYRFGNSRSSLGSFTSTASEFSGTVALPEGMAFVPPGSSISKGLALLSQSGPMVAEIPDSVAEQQLTVDYNLLVAKYRKETFDASTSPVRFKSYLTFVLGSNNTLEFSETNEFFVEEALDTRNMPEDFPLYQPRGDKFFIKYQRQQ